MVEVDSEYLEQNSFNEDIAEGSYVCLTISDNGCGIPPDNFTLIFDPFFTTKSYGRGLGWQLFSGSSERIREQSMFIRNMEKEPDLKCFFPVLKHKPKIPDLE